MAAGLHAPAASLQEGSSHQADAMAAWLHPGFGSQQESFPSTISWPLRAAQKTWFCIAPDVGCSTDTQTQVQSTDELLTSLSGPRAESSVVTGSADTQRGDVCTQGETASTVECPTEEASQQAPQKASQESLTADKLEGDSADGIFSQSSVASLIGMAREVVDCLAAEVMSTGGTPTVLHPGWELTTADKMASHESVQDESVEPLHMACDADTTQNRNIQETATADRAQSISEERVPSRSPSSPSSSRMPSGTAEATLAAADPCTVPADLMYAVADQGAGNAHLQDSSFDCAETLQLCGVEACSTVVASHAFASVASAKAASGETAFSQLSSTTSADGVPPGSMAAETMPAAEVASCTRIGLVPMIVDDQVESQHTHCATSDPADNSSVGFGKLAKGLQTASGEPAIGQQFPAISFDSTAAVSKDVSASTINMRIPEATMADEIVAPTLLDDSFACAETLRMNGMDESLTGELLHETTPLKGMELVLEKRSPASSSSSTQDIRTATVESAWLQVDTLIFPDASMVGESPSPTIADDQPGDAPVECETFRRASTCSMTSAQTCFAPSAVNVADTSETFRRDDQVRRQHLSLAQPGYLYTTATSNTGKTEPMPIAAESTLRIESSVFPALKPEDTHAGEGASHNATSDTSVRCSVSDIAIASTAGQQVISSSSMPEKASVDSSVAVSTHVVDRRGVDEFACHAGQQIPEGPGTVQGPAFCGNAPRPEAQCRRRLTGKRPAPSVDEQNIVARVRTAVASPVRSWHCPVPVTLSQSIRPAELGEQVRVFGDGWGGGSGSYLATVTEGDHLTFTVIRTSVDPPCTTGPNAWQETHVLREHCQLVPAEDTRSHTDKSCALKKSRGAKRHH
eukprot:TRINITY_DN73265_c0_g1_i1.p1 TRINITY_DN73265_c0_g1~~TRINITY_DN73265_c0_g1_i1.p1  ORF type:complete len:933 (+),score=129.29 TRINITY_DN73265_c0_g1_i1:208-2799(+)